MWHERVWPLHRCESKYSDSAGCRHPICWMRACTAIAKDHSKHYSKLVDFLKCINVYKLCGMPGSQTVPFFLSGGGAPAVNHRKIVG